MRTCRDLAQFWGFIKYEKSTYGERRQLIWSSFAPLLDHLEGKASRPSDAPISEGLKSFDADGVHAVWAKALERRESDPEGAITSARRCSRPSASTFSMRPAWRTRKGERTFRPLQARGKGTEPRARPAHRDVFKQILGGVTSVVHGLGAMRNRLGTPTAGKKPVRPAPRHAQLAVNLAGTVALFVIETWLAKSEAGNP